MDLCQWLTNFAPIGFLYKIVLLSVLNTEVTRKLRRGMGAISSGEGANNRLIDFEINVD